MHHQLPQLSVVNISQHLRVYSGCIAEYESVLQDHNGGRMRGKRP